MYKELQTILSVMPGENTLNAELKILEAYSRDVGRGIARIDYDSMDLLNASTGDVIEIRGGEKARAPEGQQPSVYHYIRLMRVRVSSELMVLLGIMQVWPLAIP
jgi:hypothetical protein